MKYVIKSADGFYMRWPGDCGRSQFSESGWNSNLENADLFGSKEEARSSINYGLGKWRLAAIVPVNVVECEEVPDAEPARQID